MPDLIPITNTPAGAQVPGAEPKRADAFGKDTFLKLLVAQLRYQDPLKPTDPQSFLAQSAQFTTVEKLEEMAKQMTRDAQVQSLSTASVLLGRTVRYAAADGSIESGTVTGAVVNADGVKLKLGDKEAALDSVTELTNPPKETQP